MRINFLIPTISVFLLTVQSSFSQLSKKTDQASSTMKSAENSVKTADNTIKGVKNVIGGVFDKKTKNKNKVLIAVTGIDYTDEALGSLKSALKKVTNVKEVAMNYKDGVAVISAVFKSAASELWEDVSFEGKTNFSIAEMSERNLALNYTSKKTIAAKN